MHSEHEMERRMGIEEFMKNNTPADRRGRPSKLTPFHEDIMLLRKNGYSQKQVSEYLAQEGVSITQAAISQYLSTHGDPGKPPGPGDDPKISAPTADSQRSDR
jgi:transposase